MTYWKKEKTAKPRFNIKNFTLERRRIKKSPTFMANNPILSQSEAVLFSRKS